MSMQPMRTNIEIDDDLMAAAMQATGHSTKKATVEEALRLVVKRASQKRALEELRGIGWEGDLEQMRLGWGPPDGLDK
jgi:Arc/MetJ family transcription regulator